MTVTQRLVRLLDGFKFTVKYGLWPISLISSVECVNNNVILLSMRLHFEKYNQLKLGLLPTCLHVLFVVKWTVGGNSPLNWHPVMTIGSGIATPKHRRLLLVLEINK